MNPIFPRGIAQGEAFYDRISERAKLKRSIKNTIHTVLIAPRRFGKTSLMTQVLYETQHPHVWLDFMTITTQEEALLKLLHKISECVVSIAPYPEKLKKLASKYFKAMKPEISLTVPGLALKLHPGEIPHQSIEEVLINLDKLASDLGERLVIVFDEFQEVLRIDNDSTFQASIRHAVERASSITYLFSGSKHRPLRKIFSGKENPLYELCDLLTIDKIAAEDYKEFINAVACKKWGYPLADKIIQKILNYTERYPKYVNALCGELWASELSPTEELVDELWNFYIISRKTDIVDDLSDLTLNQRRVLQLLCFEPTTKPYSRHYLTRLNLSQSSVQKSLEILLDKGFITNEDGVFKVLDPATRFYFTLF